MEPKPYMENDQPCDIVCEPLAAYGPEVVFDPAQRYTYADYLTWTDNKRRELIDGLKELFEE